jgi:hypothetical protein
MTCWGHLSQQLKLVDFFKNSRSSKPSDLIFFYYLIFFNILITIAKRIFKT